MKKQLALGAAFAIGVAMTGSAFASPVLTWSGNSKGSWSLESWNAVPTGNAEPSFELDVKAHAEDTGKWTLDADLGNVADIANGWAAGNVKGTLTDPNFTVKVATGADGWELDRLNGGLGLVDSGDNAGGIEVQSHGLSANLENGQDLYAQYSMPVGSTTVGVNTHTQVGPGANGTPIVSGWASQALSGFTLTGQVADKLNNGSGNNLAYSLKGETKSLIPNVDAFVQYTNKGAGFLSTAAAPVAKDDVKTEAKATYTSSPIQVMGDYWTQNNAAGNTTDMNGAVWYQGSSTYNGNGWDDAFDAGTSGLSVPNWTKNAALAAKASFETKNDGTANPTNTIGLKAISPVMPGLNVRGEYTVVSDQDGGAGDSTSGAQLDGTAVSVVGATANTHLLLNAYYALNDHMNVQPVVQLDQVSNASTSASQTTVGGDVWYGIGGNAKINAGYRNQAINGGAVSSESKFNLGYELDF